VDILPAHRLLLDFAGRNDDAHNDNPHGGNAMRARLGLLLALLIPIGAQAADSESSRPLQVQEIRCTGNSHVSCDFIRGHLHLNAGATLDEEEIRNAELRLSALRYFDSATIHLEKGAARGAVVVVIDVAENNPVRVDTVVGASHRLDVGRFTVGSRIAHQNLFGEGKFADVTAVATVPVSGPGRNESYFVLTRYVDPMLFDSRRWFGFVAASWNKGDFEDQYGNFSHTEILDLFAVAGWRFADFSYLTAGVSHRPSVDVSYGHWLRDGRFEVGDGRDQDYWFGISYGWNSEDDLLFPTQGSTFNVNAGLNHGDGTVFGGGLQFRKTWAWLGSYWTLKVGGDPTTEYGSSISESQALAVTFARPIKAGENVRRGRWYIEPGYVQPVWTPDRHVYEAGLKVGFRADTRAFGYIDLYLMGSVDVNK
jgi:outer membrane protein assembly factor BamA